MNAAGNRPCGGVRANLVPIELRIGHEVIDVWLDEHGIHFQQEGGGPSGVLPWGVAIAMSLVPPGLPQMPSVEAV